MQATRIGRHVRTTHWRVRRCFPAATLQAIETAIGEGERSHSGQVCFAVEAALAPWPLWRGQGARARALDVFSQLRVWDTEHNNGVLIYVLLADRAVEIVADRGIDAKVGAARWGEICRAMQQDFAQGDFETGALTGIEAVSASLARHYPPGGEQPNELPDKPILL